jgi:hypothetical protein
LLDSLHTIKLLDALLITSLLQQIDSADLTREEAVNIFQLKTLGLREKEVDDWHPQRVEHREDDVGAPSDVVNSGRCNLDNDLARSQSRCDVKSYEFELT